MKTLDSIDLPSLRVANEDHAWHLFSIVLNDNAADGRNDLIELLAQDGVATSVHYKPFHSLTYYRELYGLREKDFPNSEHIWSNCISLPIYPKLTERMLAYVCERLRYHLAK